MAFVPMQIQNIIDSGEDYISLLNLAKSIIIGGAACSDALIEALDQIHSPVFATYGMTETVTHIALQRLNGFEKSKYFKVLNGVEIKQLPNETIAIKSKSTDNIWVETNDIVEMLSDTEFKLIGRIDNTINSGGVKIQLEILEAKIQKIIDKNVRFFLFGLDDSKLGKKLCLVIESNNETQLEYLKVELREKLSKFEVPKEYYMIDKFIETPTSKIDKKKTINELS
jgi:O-succinylbenzoic acid--CoA ligase